MSKQYLKIVFNSLTSCMAWSLQIVQVKNSRRSGTSYICREVELTPTDKLIDFVRGIQDYYCSEKGIDSFSSVDDYTGDVVGNVVYKLDKQNELINTEFVTLIQSTATPDKEMKLSEIKANAAIFKGSVIIDHVIIPVLLVSMQKPVSTLSNRYLWIETQKFREIEEPVLTLRKTIDVAIIGDTVYLFTLAGENLFNMERSYKAVCKGRVDEIAKCDFLSNTATFISIATSGRNPRRFVAYNNDHFIWLKDKKNRKKASDKFGFRLEGDIINTTDENSVEKLIKFLCNKAMVDPCDASPVEVAATKPWS